MANVESPRGCRPLVHRMRLRRRPEAQSGSSCQAPQQKSPTGCVIRKAPPCFYGDLTGRRLVSCQKVKSDGTPGHADGQRFVSALSSPGTHFRCALRVILESYQTVDLSSAPQPALISGVGAHEPASVIE